MTPEYNHNSISDDSIEDDRPTPLSTATTQAFPREPSQVSVLSMGTTTDGESISNISHPLDGKADIPLVC